MDLIQQAIHASLSKDWKQAIKLNLQILKTTPDDIDALNRLAKAYLSSGHKTKAQTIYKKSLKIDRFNPIATKGLENLKTYRVERKINHASVVNISSAFLEEPGTTKTVSLIRLSDTKTLSRLQPGDEVRLQAHEHCVSIVNLLSEYLGRLPDDLASRLRPFIKSGNTYQAWVKSLDVVGDNPSKNNLKIFIREINRSPKFRNTPSFPNTEKLSYAAFTPPELVHFDRPRTLSPEEEDSDDFANEEAGDTENDSDSPPPQPLIPLPTGNEN